MKLFQIYLQIRCDSFLLQGDMLIAPKRFAKQNEWELTDYSEKRVWQTRVKVNILQTIIPPT